MTESNAFACRLDAAGIAARRPQQQHLMRSLVSERIASRAATFEFAPAARQTVLEFVRDESECCGFFDFTVQSTAERVSLTIEAPPGAEGMLQAVASTLR